jgi:UDP-2,3-diacylglucosamine pyrophosphatase LpxH
LRKARKGTEIIYVVGNHDEFLARFFGMYGNVSIQKDAMHVTADGRRIFVMHGHELDTVVQNLGWLAHVGDVGYTLLMRCNGAVNFMRRLFGLQYWSLSAHVKAKVKNVVSFIGKFEEAVVRYARDYDVDGVLCGHIHTAGVREIQGTTYYNTGDWVESCTAIVERFDGAMELLHLPSDVPAGAESEEPSMAEIPAPLLVLSR